LLVLAACGGASAEGPLSVSIGTDRAVLVRQLRDHQYCEGAEPPLAGDLTEMFPRCSGPGAEFSQSWVRAYYDEGGRVVKVERWEKFDDADRGLERFNALVEKRSKSSGPPSVEAKAMIGAQEELPPGTRTWVAFKSGEFALVAIYHLDPRPPENANVLEEIIEARTDGSSSLTP
jgi:hypothetical protein